MNALASQQEGTFEPETSARRQPQLYVLASEPKFAEKLPNTTPDESYVVATDALADAVHSRRPKAVFLIPRHQDNRVFRLLQLWEGQVTRVEVDVFEATLTDRTNPNNPDEQVVIDRQEVDEDDQALLRPGAIFYWSIGYEDEPGRPRRRVSQIRLRRIPGWTKQELEEAKLKAERLAELFA